MDKELERLKQLKQEAIDNPPKKKRGCKECKKSKEISAPLPQLEVVYIPTLDDIKKAYAYLGNVKEEEKKFINDVYKALFNQEFDFACGSCGNKQARRLYNYLKYELNAIL